MSIDKVYLLMDEIKRNYSIKPEPVFKPCVVKRCNRRAVGVGLCSYCAQDQLGRLTDYASAMDYHNAIRKLKGAEEELIVFGKKKERKARV